MIRTVFAGLVAGLGGTLLGMQYLPSYLSDSSLTSSCSESDISASPSKATLGGGGGAVSASGNQELADGVPTFSEAHPIQVVVGSGCSNPVEFSFPLAVEHGLEHASLCCCDGLLRNCPCSAKRRINPDTSDAKKDDYAPISSAEGSNLQVAPLQVVDPYLGALDKLNSGSMCMVTVQGLPKEREPLLCPDVTLQSGGGHVEGTGMFGALQIPINVRAETVDFQIDPQSNEDIGAASEIETSNPDINEFVDDCKREMMLDLLQNPSRQNLSP